MNSNSNDQMTKSLLINDYQRQVIESDEAPDILDFLTFTDATDQLATVLLPAVSSLSFFLSLVALLALAKTPLNSAPLKYSFYNTLFDLATLLLVVCKPLLKFWLTEDLFELYLYAYLTSVALTCSNLTRLAYAFDRYSKMRPTRTLLFKHKSHSIALLAYVTLSAVLNAPILLEYSCFDVAWFKQTFYELTLNERGAETLAGILAMLNAIVLNLGVYISVIVVNMLLKRALKQNLEKLAQLISIEQNRDRHARATISILDELKDRIENYDDDDDDDNGESEEPFDLGQVHSVKITHRNVNCENETGLNLDAKEKAVCESKKSRPTHIEIEKARRKMCSMIFCTNFLFIIGRTMFIVCALHEQAWHLVRGKAHKRTYEENGKCNLLANAILYLSMGFNFFIYAYYVRRFRQVIANAFVCTVCSVCCTIQQIRKKHAKKNLRN